MVKEDSIVVDGFVLIPMWWGGFSEMSLFDLSLEEDNVLIPMWWGGFSEENWMQIGFLNLVLIPMWWGGFSESGGVFSLLNSAG